MPEKAYRFEGQVAAFIPAMSRDIISGKYDFV